MALLPIPPCDAGALKSRLLDEYGVEIPITGYKDQRCLRISVQGYNSQADIDTMVRALTDLLPEVANA